MISKKKMGVPHYFKWIGAGIAITAFIAPLILKLLKIDIEGEKEFLKTITLNVINIGLLLIVLANDKFEDERSGYIKKLCFTFAFVWGVIYSFIYPFVNSEGSPISAAQLILSMLLVYIFMYFIQRRRL